jgi:hypothetical protein
MKMQATDYRLLKQAIVSKIASQELDLAATAIDYRKQGLSEMRMRWDLIRFCGIKIGDSVGCPGPFPFYDYLNDNHIDTALKSIVNELLEPAMFGAI